MTSIRPSPPPRFRANPAPTREPHLLHFGLKQLLFFVAAVSALLAVLVDSDGVWSLAIGVSALLIAAHVFGTLIGTRLRNTSAEVRDWRSASSGAQDDPVRTTEPVAKLRAGLPAATMLSKSHQAPLRDRMSAAAGAAVGLILGFTAILLTGGAEVSWAGVAIGAVACAVIGGWFAWLTAGFGVMARNAWREANQADELSRSKVGDGSSRATHPSGGRNS